MDVAAIRHALRYEDSPSLQRRRKIATRSAIALVDFALLSLFQLGVVRRLPDFPGRIFDSKKVNSSRNAYQFGTPDGPLGIMSFATNILLSGIGGRHRVGRSPWWSIFLAASVANGAAFAAYYLYEMIFTEQKVCPYCLLGAFLNVSMLPSALREGQHAAGLLRAH